MVKSFYILVWWNNTGNRKDIWNILMNLWTRLLKKLWNRWSFRTNREEWGWATFERCQWSTKHPLSFKCFHPQPINLFFYILQANIHCSLIIIRTLNLDFEFRRQEKAHIIQLLGQNPKKKPKTVLFRRTKVLIKNVSNNLFSILKYYFVRCDWFCCFALNLGLDNDNIFQSHFRLRRPQKRHFRCKLLSTLWPLYFLDTIIYECGSKTCTAVISVLTYHKTYTTTSFLFHKYSSQTVHNTQRFFRYVIINCFKITVKFYK